MTVSDFTTALRSAEQPTADWLLPDGVADVLFGDAQKQENLRTSLLYVLTSYGYQLVSPPLIEYTETLLKNAPEDLKRQTFKLIDQMTGRLMGLRADITPQILRIDSQHGAPIARYCYAGAVVQTLPAGLFGLRTPMQLGAEVFGVADVAADLHLMDLVCALFAEIGVPVHTLHVDVGHVGLFRRLCVLAKLGDNQILNLIDLYQKKSLPALKSYCETLPLGADFLYLASHALDATNAKQVAMLTEGLSADARADSVLMTMMDELAKLCAYVDELGLSLSVDVGDLSGFHYHTGLIFSVYVNGAVGDRLSQSQALLRGGRFVGQDRKGNVRPATGFSMDVNQLLGLVDNEDDTVILVDYHDYVAATASERQDLRQQITTLQEEGCVVIVPLCADDMPEHKDGVLHLEAGQWAVHLVAG